MMKRRDFARLLGAGAMAGALGSAGRAAAVSRPNIVVVLTDDMGYSDLGCYGGEIATPHLDALAAAGVRFTQFYNTARCCPTRASLLTGLYPHQAGVGHMVADKGQPGYQGDLNEHCVTLAEVLKPAGYGTYAVGKWHVTKHLKPDAPNFNWPRQRGFDRYYGTLTGAGSFFRPATLMRDNEPITEFPEDYYYTDAIGDESAGFVRAHHRERPGDPLFMYVAFTAAHWPLHARKEDIVRYRGKYLKGWDAVRAERHARMIEMGLVRKEWPMTDRDASALKWDTLSDEQKNWLDLKMAIYAAQVDSMDRAVGRIVEALRETGRLENTLLLYMQDNGACAEGGAGGFERGKKGDLNTLGSEATFSSYGLSWANASNTPFRLYKHYTHEGGVSTPLIAHWPAGIAARGELRHEPGHLIDIMATCVDVAGAAYPAERGGKPVRPMEGRSLGPVFAGQPIEREGIYWEHEGNRAIRAGKWKLVAKGAQGPWELYDMEDDRTETKNLAAAHPDVAVDLAARWQAWGERADVLPLPGAKKAPKEPRAPKTYSLKAGDTLEGAQAPQVWGSSFSIQAEIEAAAEASGVILAQGGTNMGYALYLDKGRPAFIVRSGGRKETAPLVGAEALPAGRVTLEASLVGKGQGRLAVNGAVVATGDFGATIKNQPDEPLTVGQDAGKPVGPYKAPASFPGSIHSLTVTSGQK